MECGGCRSATTSSYTVTYAAKGGAYGFVAIDPTDGSVLSTTPIGSSVDDNTLQMVGTLGPSRVLYQGTKRGLFSVSAADPPPCACAPSCEDIDLVCDRVIDCSDLAVLLTEWGTVKGAAAADLNNDGEVNSLDLGLLVGAWGPCVFLTGTGEGRARVHNNSRAGVWRKSKRGSKLNCGNHRASRAEAAAHSITIVARADQKSLGS